MPIGAALNVTNANDLQRHSGYFTLFSTKIVVVAVQGIHPVPVNSIHGVQLELFNYTFPEEQHNFRNRPCQLLSCLVLGIKTNQ